QDGRKWSLRHNGSFEGLMKTGRRFDNNIIISTTYKHTGTSHGTYRRIFHGRLEIWPFSIARETARVLCCPIASFHGVEGVRVRSCAKSSELQVADPGNRRQILGRD